MLSLLFSPSVTLILPSLPGLNYFHFQEVFIQPISLFRLILFS